MPLTHRVKYNSVEDIVEVDLSELTLSTEILDNFLFHLNSAAEKLDHKTYGLICWQHTKLPADLADYYGDISAKALKNYLAFVRYGVDDVVANATVRSQVVRRGVQGSRSHIYPTKEAALETIRSMRADAKLSSSPLTSASLTTKVVAANHATIFSSSAVESELISFYDSPYATIYWNAKYNCVQTYWKGFVEGRNLREAMDKGLEILQTKKAPFWLADLRKLGVISQADQEWISRDWFPRAMQIGLTKRATILPEKAVGKMSVNRVSEQMNNRRVESAIFQEVGEAYYWFEHS